MANIRSNIDKIIKSRMAQAKIGFKMRHPFKKFDEQAARRVIKKRVARELGSSSCYVPHQGKQECARRVRQGNAPMQYVKAVGKNLAMTDAQVQEFLERQNAKVQSTV